MAKDSSYIISIFGKRSWNIYKHAKIAAAIELTRANKLIRSYDGGKGRPASDRVNIAHAFIAKAMYNLQTRVLLIDKLHCDPVLRRFCAWERKSDIPSESTFPIAFGGFFQENLAARLHSLVGKYHSDRRSYFKRFYRNRANGKG